MPAICRVARQRKLFILEDAAQAVGAEIAHQREVAPDDVPLGELRAVGRLGERSVGDATQKKLFVTAEQKLAARAGTVPPLLGNHPSLLQRCCTCPTRHMPSSHARSEETSPLGAPPDLVG